jgi:arginine decarboxylase
MAKLNPALDQSQAPYLDAIASHREQGILSFHVPGHQAGRGADPRLHDLLGSSLLSADLTEVLGIDDLHRPHDQILHAQRLAAAAFGAEETHFLVNGSTSGNHAMLLACSGPGELVLVPRNAHRSIWGGLMLSGASAAVYDPPFDESLGVYTVATPRCVARAAAQHPQASALVLYSPAYHGHAANTVGVVQTAHEHGLLVLADEAWGAHLPFHPGYPVSAVQAGADLTVQSSHKMLPALTQAAMLHVRGPRIDRPRLRGILSTILSSSPSAPLLVSLDSARRQFATEGYRILEEVARLAELAQQEIAALDGLFCRGGKLQGEDQVSLWDPARLVVSARGRGYSGYELEATLRYEHGIQIEMSDMLGVVVALTAGHQEQHLRALVRALASLPHKASDTKSLERVAPPLFPQTVLTPRTVLQQPSQQVGWREALGQLSAETVTLYPPGVPWLLPGQPIDQATLDSLREAQQAGGKVQGASDPSLQTLAVLTR